MKFQYTLLGTLMTIAATIAVPRTALGADPSLAMADPSLGGAQAPQDYTPVTIISPLDHEVLDSPRDTRLHYYIRASAGAKKLRLTLDGGPPTTIDEVTGCPCSVKLPFMASGRHELTLKALPGGSESTIVFTIIGGLR